MMNWKVFLLAPLSMFATVSSAYEPASWYVRHVTGYSHMEDLNANSQGLGAVDGEANTELSGGFNAGLGIGYQLSFNLATELAWEYRRNDSRVLMPDSKRYDDGDYSAQLFSLNGIYQFDSFLWQPYWGAGVIWAQNIELDLEQAAEEHSFSTGGNTGYQVFAGINYLFSPRWSFQGEVKYSLLNGLSLDSEGDYSQIGAIDYEAITAQLGVVYFFGCNSTEE